jgi:hypothetical protein
MKCCEYGPWFFGILRRMRAKSWMCFFWMTWQNRKFCLKLQLKIFILFVCSHLYSGGQCCKLFYSGSSAEVEQLLNQPKVKGLSPATTVGTGRDRKVKKTFFTASFKLLHYKLECLWHKNFFQIDWRLLAVRESDSSWLEVFQCQTL